MSKLDDQSQYTQQVLKAQLYVQNNMDQQLPLKKVAQVAGLSESTFHRIFKQFTDETLKKYVDRLRVQKSIYNIRVSDMNLLRIALRNGFNSAETYSRVFKRITGVSPSHYQVEVSGKGDKQKAIKYKSTQLVRESKDSNFSIVRTPQIHLAFSRHIGPYEEVPLVAAHGNHLWRQLEQFVTDRKLIKPPFSYIGIGHDSPESTAADKMRFDCCIQVNQVFRGGQHIAYQCIQSGTYGVLTFAGSYENLPLAYHQLFTQAMSLNSYEINDGPVFELLLDVDAKTSQQTTWTELYIPLKRKVKL